ncbi:MAG: 50S ribosomal protein L25 [Deltaproteobacteria bacterium]|nr:50S ribosomal protein L25 [Deltaproteobacteria bacterium]
MEPLTVEVEHREETGKSVARKLRREGYIPGVVYGEKQAARGLAIEGLHFGKRVNIANTTQLYTLKSKSKELDGLTVLLKNVQLEPIKSRVTHVDFLAVTEDHKIVATVPIHLLGVCQAVKLGNAVLNHVAHEIDVKCLPREIPQFIEVNISALEAGDSIQAGDIAMPQNVVLISDPKLSIVSIIVKREAEEAPATPATPEAAGTTSETAKAKGSS